MRAFLTNTIGGTLRLLANPRMSVGVGILLALVLLGLVGPMFVDVRLSEPISVRTNQPPSWAHPLGTDSGGRELIAVHGGKATVVAELHAPPPDGLPLPGPIDGSSLRFESAVPLQDVARLVERGLRFDALNIQQPDLESVFLALTGRRLRDD